MLWDRLFRLKHNGVTLVVSTHYMDEAEQPCDRLVVMHSGRIVAQGSPAEPIAEHSSREVLELRFLPGTQDAAEAAVTPLVDRIEMQLIQAPVRVDGAEMLPCPIGCCPTPTTATSPSRRRRPSGSARQPRWSADPRWRTCSCGRPAGAWSTDEPGRLMSLIDRRA